jgi:hypothetical protein
MNAQPSAPAGLDDPIGVERPSRWPWAVPRVGLLSGEGSGPHTVQGSGTFTSSGSQGNDLADVGAFTGSRGPARSPARLASARTVIDGGGRSWTH